MIEEKTTNGRVELAQLAEREIGHDIYKALSPAYRNAVERYVAVEVERRTCTNDMRKKTLDTEAAAWYNYCEELRCRLADASPTTYPATW